MVCTLGAKSVAPAESGLRGFRSAVRACQANASARTQQKRNSLEKALFWTTLGTAMAVVYFGGLSNACGSGSFDGSCRCGHLLRGLCRLLQGACAAGTSDTATTRRCANGGTVTGTTGACACSCAAGYEGNDCDTPSPPAARLGPRLGMRGERCASVVLPNSG